MAPSPWKMGVAVGVVLSLAVLVSGGQTQHQPAAAAQLGGHADSVAAAPPAPLRVRGAHDGAELGTTTTTLPPGIGNIVVGDVYIGCLEMGLSRCYADPTLLCVEDAMVECSLQAAASAPAAAATTGPAAPLPGGAAAELALGGIVGRGIAVGVKYIGCLEVGLAEQCFSKPTVGCIEKTLGSCI